MSLSSLNPDVKFTFVFEDDRWKTELSQKAWQQKSLNLAQEVFRQVQWFYPSLIDMTFTHDKAIARLNGLYRHKDQPTNVLSFPQLNFSAPGVPLDYEILSDQEGKSLQVPLGDIVFSFETVIEEAKRLEIPFLDHVQHLMVHGILHLLGFDHVTDQEASVMEPLEIHILSKIGVKNPYNSFCDSL